MKLVTVAEKMEIVARDMHGKMGGYYTMAGCREFVGGMYLDELNATYAVICAEV